MTMNWDQAIERQRGALARIIATLFAMVGLTEGSTITRIPFPLYRAVLRVLYPAESAVRRLVMVAARGLAAKPPVRRPVPAGLKAVPRKAGGRLSFQLCDPRKSFDFESEANRSGPKFEPRLHAFVNGELATILGRSPLTPAPQIATAADATRLCRRLSAIKSALENLPREAKRLVRWQARRHALPPEKIRKAIRPGRPPGHRKQSTHEVDEILKDCHWLAWEAARPDTS